MIKKNLLLICFVLFWYLNGFCSEKPEVVVYTALDQLYSEPILMSFQEDTGIIVKAVFDIESVKTTGLVNRLIAEKRNPQCDVFWNNEVVRSIILKRKGILASYYSPISRDIPKRFKDRDGYWTGFAARARVLVVNTNLVKPADFPKSIFDLTASSWGKNAAIANPLFGTASTHIAALFAALGHDAAKQFLMKLKKNQINVVNGNSVVRDMVGAGELPIGLTDTDDVNVGIQSGLPIIAIYPDKNGIGTLVIPNTVCLIKNGPNPKEGRLLVDYLLSKRVEEKLAHSQSAQMPLRPDVKAPSQLVSIREIKAMDVNFDTIADLMETSGSFVQEIFIR